MTENLGRFSLVQHKLPDTAGRMEYSSGCQADRAANNSDQMITDRCQNQNAAQNDILEHDIKMEESQSKEGHMEIQGTYFPIWKTNKSGKCDTPLSKQVALNDLAGITPEELHEKTVQDITAPNLDILFVGINPGYHSALTGHHYSGTGNHFWTCLYQSGLLPEPLVADRDREVLDHKIGLCNVVARTTASGQDLSSSEIREGCRRLVEKLSILQPLVACFNGKSIWEYFSREMMPGTYKKREFVFGRQDIIPIPGVKAVFYVMPSSSARCAAYPTSDTKLPWFREVKNIKDKIKIEEAASKGVAGISGIGINLQKFQPVRTLVGLTSNELSPKVYSGSPRPHLILQDDGKERKGKKRPIEDLDHPKSKQKHMADPIPKDVPERITPQISQSVQHRLAGGGISTDMLKDPSENERMERVRRWVNNQDFSRASPEPPIHDPNDIYKLLAQQPNSNYMPAMPILHPNALLHQPELWPALGLSADDRILQSAYNLPPGVSSQLASSNNFPLGAFQGLSSGLHNALNGGGGGLQNNPGTPWPYGAIPPNWLQNELNGLKQSQWPPNWLQNELNGRKQAQFPSGISPSLYRFPTITPYEWSKALTGAADSSARVIPFVPVIPAGGLAGLSNSLSFVLPGQNQSVLYPPGYSVNPPDSKNPPQ